MIFDEIMVVDDAEPHRGALNMALDEVLMRVGTQPTLRLYRWAGPAVSFGYFGRAREVMADWVNVDVVRRWTGGGVVPHGNDFTYSLMVPREHPLARLTAAESYRSIHEAVARALAAEATLAAAGSSGGSSACFENPVLSDVILGGQKAAGAAQRRTSAGLLHQGSVQLVDEPHRFAERLIACLAGHVRWRCLQAEEISAGEALAARKYGTREWLYKF